MACTGSSLTVENYEDSPASVSTSAIAGNESVKQRVPYSRRRHSSFHPRTDRRGSDGSSMEGEEGYLLRVSLIPSHCFMQELCFQLRVALTYYCLYS